MNSIETYNQQVIKLANSLCIKLLDVALAINKGLIKDGYKVPNDKKQWKYFLNLAGIKHETNNDVKVTVIELGEKRSISRDLLDKYVYTKNELLKNDDFYNILVDEYKDDIMFIHGCMYPVDIQTAIDAKEGTILNYNTTLVEVNEYTLIKELEEHIKSFLSRWHIKTFTVIEELYLPSMLAVLYSTLPQKISNIRLEKIYTNEAHSFHLENFFNSYLNLWNDIKRLTPATKYWLYKNLTNIVKNIGINSNLNIVIDKILSANQIGVGEYRLVKYNNEQVERSASCSNPSFQYGKISIQPSAKNNYYVIEGTKKELSDVLTIELTDNEVVKSDLDKLRDSYIIQIAENTINDKIITTKFQKTKILEIYTYQLFKKQGIDLFKVILDYWINGVMNQTIQYMLEYVEPNDNKSYLLTADTALLVLLKIILKITKRDNLKLKHLNYDLILDTDKESINKAYHIMLQDGYIVKFFKDLQDNYPLVNKTCINVNEFKTLLNSIMTWMSYLWTIDVNSENAIVSSNVKYLFNLITQKGKYKLSDKEDGETIDEILYRNNINYTLLDSYDLDKSLEAMVSQFTGISLDETAILKEISNGFTSMLDKLTSYTTQVVRTNVGENSIFMYYNNTNLFRSETGIVKVDPPEFLALETEYANLKVYANNFSDRATNMSTPNIELSAYEAPKEWKINGLYTITKNQDIVYLYPKMYAYEMNTEQFGMNNATWIEPQLLSDIKIEFIPLEKTYTKLDIDADTQDLEDNIIYETSANLNVQNTMASDINIVLPPELKELTIQDLTITEIKE